MRKIEKNTQQKYSEKNFKLNTATSVVIFAWLILRLAAIVIEKKRENRKKSRIAQIFNVRNRLVVDGSILVSHTISVPATYMCSVTCASVNTRVASMCVNTRECIDNGDDVQPYTSREQQVSEWE